MVNKSFKEILENKTEEWMAIPGVIGVSQGKYRGSPCLIVYLSTPQVNIPKKVGGFYVIHELLTKPLKKLSEG